MAAYLNAILGAAGGGGDFLSGITDKIDPKKKMAGMGQGWMNGLNAYNSGRTVPPIDMNAVMNQSVLSAPGPNPMPPTDPVEFGVQQSASSAQPVSRKPAPIGGTQAPAQAPAQAAGSWDDVEAALAGQEPIRPEPPGFFDQLGTAINDGAGILGAGLGALAAPVEMVMAPVSGVLEQLAGSPLGRFGGGFGRGQANYQHGGFGLTPGPNQLQGMSGGQMDPAAIQAEIDRLQQMLLQSGG